MSRPATPRRSIWCPAPSRRATAALARCGDGSSMPSAAPAEGRRNQTGSNQLSWHTLSRDDFSSNRHRMKRTKWGRLSRRPHCFSNRDFGKNTRPTAAASEPAAASKKQPHDEQQDDGADRGIKDLAHEAGADGDAEPWKQQAGDQRAGDTDENIADDPKAGAAHDLPGQPACDQADEQNNENAFIGHVHRNFPTLVYAISPRCVRTYR